MNHLLKREGKFQYIEKGEGPVLLLLHGLFGALSNWTQVLSYFSKSYKVVIPIMPLYEMPLSRTNVDGLSDFVFEFMTEKQYGPATLIGNSLGGHVALVFTLDHPELVQAMILTGSSGLYENSMGGSFPKRQDYNFIRQRTEYTFYDPKTATKELVDEVYEICNNRNKALRIVTMAKSAIRHNLRKEMATIRIPVCLIWGKQDTITPPQVAEEFNKLLPNSELYMLDKCGHAPMMERAEEFNKIAGTFIDKIYQTQPA